jgi:hypothetical protein
MYLFIVFCYPHHYKTFTTATSNTIGGHLGKGKNVQVGIKVVYLMLRTDDAPSILFPTSLHAASASQTEYIILLMNSIFILCVFISWYFHWFIFYICWISSQNFVT